VARDVASQLTNDELYQHKLSMENGITSFRGFRDQNTCIRVLAPEWNIDGTYLGEFVTKSSAFLDPLLLHTSAYTVISENVEAQSPGMPEGEVPTPDVPQPANVSTRDFRLLRSRLLYSAMAFSQEDDDLKNNVSVVLLLEWRGRRLLFTGDAEWDGTGVQKGQRNSSWDVLLANQDVRDILLQPLDLLKVAHHGSHNGSPFDPEGETQILQKITSPDRTHIVVSTVVGVHGKKNPVPYVPLLKELGQLAANQKVYPDCEPELKELAQPRRTDLESDSSEAGVDYLDEKFNPKLK